MEFIYLVFPRMPGGVTVGNSGLLLCPSGVERYKLPTLDDSLILIHVSNTTFFFLRFVTKHAHCVLTPPEAKQKETAGMRLTSRDARWYHVPPSCGGASKLSSTDPVYTFDIKSTGNFETKSFT